MKEGKIEKIETNEEKTNIPTGELIEPTKEGTERQKEEVVNNIKKMIMNEELCSHSPNYILEYLISSLGNNSPKNTADRYKEAHEKLGIMKSIFEHGIWSSEKIDLDRKQGNKSKIKHYSMGFGGAEQENSLHRAYKLADIIYKYLQKKKEAGEDIKNISYESVIQREDFKTLLNFTTKGEVDNFLKSRRTKFLFNRWKRLIDGSTKRFPKGITTETTLFGHNLISSLPPQAIREGYEKTGKIVEGWYDTLQILFKRPKEASTFELITEDDAYPAWDGKKGAPPRDLGIANAVYPKNFIAVVIDKEKIDKEGEKIPKEFLDIIPKNLPVITRNFEVIRLPKKETKEVVKEEEA